MESDDEKQRCVYCTADGYGLIEAINPETTVTAGTVQKFIDKYLKNSSNSSVDYIHGRDVSEKLGRQDGNIGILLPAIPKKTFFRTVVTDGAFPRKTFSMGEASEKRFYLECRKIK